MRRTLIIVGTLLIAILLAFVACGAPAEVEEEEELVTPEEEEVAAAKFEVISLNIKPLEAMAGETVSITAVVENIGGSEGTYAVILTVDGVTTEASEVMVTPGSSKVVTFSLVKDAPGTYEISIGGLTSTLIVEEEEVVVTPEEEEEVAAPEEPQLTLYEDTEHGFSIEYPEGWTENVLRAGAYFMLEITDSEGRLIVEVSLEYGAEDIVLTDFVSETKTYMEAMPEFELSSEGDVTIGEGIPGYELVGKGDLDTGKVDRFRYVMLVRGKQGFWVGVRGEPAYFDQQEQIIATIIDSFKLLATYTFVPPAPSAGGTYTSDEHGFSISYPEGWMEASTRRPGEVIVLASAEGLPSVSVSISPVDEGTTLAEYGAQLNEGLSQYWSDYELVSEGEITLADGTPAYEIVFSGTMEGDNLKCKYVIVIRGAQAFFIMGFTMPDQFEQDEAVLDEVIRSFHLE